MFVALIKFSFQRRVSMISIPFIYFTATSNKTKWNRGTKCWKANHIKPKMKAPFPLSSVARSLNNNVVQRYEHCAAIVFDENDCKNCVKPMHSFHTTFQRFNVYSECLDACLLCMLICLVTLHKYTTYTRAHPTFYILFFPRTHHIIIKKEHLTPTGSCSAARYHVYASLRMLYRERKRVCFVGDRSQSHEKVCFQAVLFIV